MVLLLRSYYKKYVLQFVSRDTTSNYYVDLYVELTQARNLIIRE